jgi:hypothetical protein
VPLCQATRNAINCGMALSTARQKVQLAPAQQYEALANVRLALSLSPFVAVGCHAFGMCHDVIMNADILIYILFTGWMALTTFSDATRTDYGAHHGNPQRIPRSQFSMAIIRVADIDTCHWSTLDLLGWHTNTFDASPVLTLSRLTATVGAQ